MNALEGRNEQSEEEKFLPKNLSDFKDFNGMFGVLVCHKKNLDGDTNQNEKVVLFAFLEAQTASGI